MTPARSHRRDQSAAWWLRRLRAMSAAEVVARSRDVRSFASLYAGRDKRIESEAGKAAVAIEAPPVDDELREAVIDAASAWIDRRGPVFEIEAGPSGEPIDWSCDYSTGRSAPLRPSILLNHRNSSRFGDARYTWELNRMQWLLPLAMAAAWTKRESYIAAIESSLRSWRRHNPFLQGINWTSPLEAGLRLVVWTYVAALTRGIERCEAFFAEEMATSLHQHQRFVDRMRSHDSSANNHLIGEMAGLYLAATVFPWFAESPVWAESARRALEAGIVSQVEPDGVARERAIDYQLFIMELLLSTASLASRCGAPFSDGYWQRLAAMSHFIDTIHDRRGNWPNWGDGDGSQAIALPDSATDRAKALCRWHGAEADGVPQTAAALRLWLLRWAAPSASLPASPTGAPAGTTAFERGGYVVLASARGSADEIVVGFDAAPLGMAPLAAHGHADALSVWMSSRGEPILIDPGTYAYYRDERWRDYFRGTAAHNTIRVDGAEQSTMGGRFLWSQHANCRLHGVDIDPRCLTAAASHDGYSRLADPVAHTRLLRLEPDLGRLAIEDRIDCAGKHSIELFFHFDSSCSLAQVEAHRWTAQTALQQFSIELDRRCDCRLARGETDPICGWQSRRFGTREPAPTLIARLDTSGACRIESTFTRNRESQS